MHTAVLAVISIIVWSAVWAALPVKLAAIAGSAFVIIATLKKIFPSLGGWYAMALNIALSVCGVLMVATPQDFSNPNFWAGLMLTIASASGIQGVVKQATAPATLPGSDQKMQVGQGQTGNSGAIPQSRGGTTAALILCLALSFGLSGCGLRASTPPTAPAVLPTGAADQVDADTNKALRPAHDFAASISTDVISGKLKVTAGQQQALEQFNRSLNTADAAEKSYHGCMTAVVIPAPTSAGCGAMTLAVAVSTALQQWSVAVASAIPVAAK